MVIVKIEGRHYVARKFDQVIQMWDIKFIPFYHLQSICDEKYPNNWTFYSLAM